MLRNSSILEIGLLHLEFIGVHGFPYKLMGNSADPDQTPRFAVSDLGLLFLSTEGSKYPSFSLLSSYIFKNNAFFPDKIFYLHLCSFLLSDWLKKSLISRLHVLMEKWEKKIHTFY